MKKMKPLCFMLLFFIHSGLLFAQPYNLFGKIEKKDFDINSSLIDSTTGCIALFNIGSCSFEGNDKGWFSIVYTKHTRIKILKKSAYSVATIKEFLYNGDIIQGESIQNIKASTFNIDNNVIVETKMNNKDVLTSNFDRNYIEKIFTLPSVKVGSIIEYTYSIHSDYIDFLRPWKFENEYPCLYNEYSVSIPSIFNYISDFRKYIPVEVTRKTTVSNFTIKNDFNTALSNSIYTISGNVNITKWISKDIPEIKIEDNISTINNFISKVDFQMSEILLPDQPVQKTRNTWNKIFDDLKYKDDFGVQIYSKHRWLKDSLSSFINDLNDTLSTTKKIYEYVRNNFLKTKGTGILFSDNTNLKDIYNNKKGTSSEINILLIAMLKALNINAEPTILSTRSNGIVHPLYPVISEYNYLICFLNINNKEYYLDASEPGLGFGKLPLDCYNGFAITLMPHTVNHYFTTDSLIENGQVLVYASASEKGKLNAICQETPGYYQSLNFRNEYSRKSNPELVNIISKDFASEVNIINFSVDSMNQFENPVKINYTAIYNFTKDVVYFNPLLKYSITENPYKSEKRIYPVENPYSKGLNYIITIEVPKGYTIEEIPKSIKIKLNDNDGFFEYSISNNNDLIQLECNLYLYKAKFPAESYQYLRDFYGKVVKKMNEEIVFKKIK